MGSTKRASVLDAAGAPKGHKPEGRGRDGRVNPPLSVSPSRLQPKQELLHSVTK